MRFPVAILPTLLLVGTVLGCHGPNNAKDIAQRSEEENASQPLEFNDWINEVDINSEYPQESALSAVEDMFTKPMFRVDQEFGVVQVDLKPLLNLVYNLFKPIDPEVVTKKFLKALFSSLEDPLFDSIPPDTNKSIESVISSILKGINPFKSDRKHINDGEANVGADNKENKDKGKDKDKDKGKDKDKIKDDEDDENENDD